MNVAAKVTLFCISLGAGWVSPNYLSGYFLPPTSCHFEYYYIHKDTPGKTTVYSQLGGEPDNENWKYFAHITQVKNSSVAYEGQADYALKVIRNFYLTYHTMSTVWSQPVYQSANSIINEKSYLDPFVTIGFTAPVYIFHAGSKWMIGYKERPRYICSG